jgi:hypothetical protein
MQPKSNDSIFQLPFLESKKKNLNYLILLFIYLFLFLYLYLLIFVYIILLLNYFSAPRACLLRFLATGASTATGARMTQQKIAETTFSSPASNESDPALDQVSLLTHFK